jgi:nucleoside 2-deoxyribosyltransferase
MTERGWVSDRQNSEVWLKGDGFIRGDELTSHSGPGDQAFVAMSFDTGLNDVYIQGLQRGIEEAGYRSLRLDNKEHINRIDDEIIAEIRRSKFLVADFTGHRGGVYFEASFAMGLGYPVVLTCRKSDKENLHFDLRQYNFIDWETPDELRDRLCKRIAAVIGYGPSQEANDR